MSGCSRGLRLCQALAEEKARITRLLLENGEKLFTSQGLRKTSLEELMAPTGVAKSSFYLFLDSKEALYLELMLRQSGEVKRRVIDDTMLSTGRHPRRGVPLPARHHRGVVGQPATATADDHPEEMQAVARS